MNRIDKTCPECDGRRFVLPERPFEEEPAETVEMKKCLTCDGEGKIIISKHNSP